MKKIRSILFFLFAGIILSAQVPPPPPPPLNAEPTKDVRDTDDVFSYAEVMPKFSGPGTFPQYLAANVKYPLLEKEAGKTGTVYITFTIEKDGSITNVRAAKEVQGAPGFTKEGIRVIRASPKWTPGLMNGRPVRIDFTQPIKFTLDNGEPAKPVVKIQPQFPGGDSALANYISKNLIYPAKEKKKHKEGDVVVTFIVEADGSISNVYVISEVEKAPGFTKEAIRLVTAMPKWEAGKLNGTATDMAVQITVNFKL